MFVLLLIIPLDDAKKNSYEKPLLEFLDLASENSLKDPIVFDDDEEKSFGNL